MNQLQQTTDNAPLTATAPQTALRLEIDIHIPHTVKTYEQFREQVTEAFSEYLRDQATRLGPPQGNLTESEAYIVWLAGSELLPNAYAHGIFGLSSDQTGNLNASGSEKRAAILAIINEQLSSGKAQESSGKFTCDISEDFITVRISGIGSFPSFKERWEIAQSKALSGNVPLEELIIPNNRGFLILAGFYNEAHHSGDSLIFIRNRKEPPKLPEDEFPDLDSPHMTD